jgi:hypothetical protein
MWVMATGAQARRAAGNEADCQAICPRGHANEQWTKDIADFLDRREGQPAAIACRQLTLSIPQF